MVTSPPVKAVPVIETEPPPVTAALFGHPATRVIVPPAPPVKLKSPPLAVPPVPPAVVTALEVLALYCPAPPPLAAMFTDTAAEAVTKVVLPPALPTLEELTSFTATALVPPAPIVTVKVSPAVTAKVFSL